MRKAFLHFVLTGIALIVLASMLLILTIIEYNSTRYFNLYKTVIFLVTFMLGQTFLISSVTTYLLTRTRYTLPQLPSLPKAETVALIPAYNEEKTIADVVSRAKKHVDLVIVVDDGSSDKTAEHAQKAGAIVIRHPTNMGKGAAVITLLKAAKLAGAKYAVFLDADGQHDPDEIPKLLQPLLTGEFDVAIGNRFATKLSMPFIRMIGYKILALIHTLLIAKIPDPFNGYRALGPKALEKLQEDFDPTYGVEIEMNHKLKGLKIVSIPVAVMYQGKTSKAHPVIQALNLLWSIFWVYTYEKPIYIIILSIITSITSISILIYTIYLFNITRYIRLSYTVIAFILEILLTIILALGITFTANNRNLKNVKKYNFHS